MREPVEKKSTALSKSLDAAKISYKSDLNEQAIDNLGNSDEYQNRIKEISNDIQSEMD
jgi:hypothetical protein